MGNRVMLNMLKGRSHPTLVLKNNQELNEEYTLQKGKA